MLHKSFKPAKCKTALNLAKSRIKLMKNKKESQVKQLRRELAQLLESGQDQTARIRVEHVVREEKMMDAYELIEIYCELIVARLPIIESQKNCPLDLKEAITSLIFAAPRCGDIPELQDIRKHFVAKYGKEFVAAAIELHPACGVSRTMVEKLSVKAPDGPTKVKILTAIAEEHNLKWEPKWFKDEDELPSTDLPKVQHMEKANVIQMEPLNFEISDNLQQQHAHDEASSATSPQRHSHAGTHVDMVPQPAISCTDSKPSGSSKERRAFGQSSGTAENVFSMQRQNWNMEFKDATAAAQAAAESAERASMAARAAAELSSQGKIVNDSSGSLASTVQRLSEGSRVYASSGLQQEYEDRSPANSLLNRKGSGTKGDQLDAIAREKVKDVDGRTSNEDYTESGVQYDFKRKGFKENKTSSYPVQSMSRQSRDSFSVPNTSRGASNLFESLNQKDYGNDYAENPFHEETVEIEKQPSSFQSQESTFGNEDSIFSNLNDHNKNDSDGYFGNFNQGTAKYDDSHFKTAHHPGSYGVKEDMSFKDKKESSTFLGSVEQKHLFHSSDDVFVGMDRKTNEMDMEEMDPRIDTGVVFDESGSDDDEYSFDHVQKPHDLPSPGKSSSNNFLFHGENSSGNWGCQSSISSHPHDVLELSESFRESPFFSKLSEPVPIAFDSDGESSGNEKELLRVKAGPVIHIVGYGEPDSNIVASSEPQTSPPSGKQTLMSPDPASEIGYGAHSNPEGGMELNFGLLPHGLRNRPYQRPPYTRGDSASSHSSTAVSHDSFDTGQQSSPRFKFETSSVRTENTQVPGETSGVHTYVTPSRVDPEVKTVPNGSTIMEKSYGATARKDLHKTSPKSSTWYFDSDEEDDPKQSVMSKNFMGAGISRRTKASAPRSVAISKPFLVSDFTPEMGRSSSSYASETSPKLQTETTGYRSRITDPSRSDGEATTRLRPQRRVSKEEQSLSSSITEKPVTLKGVEISSASNSNVRAPSRENSTKYPSHVHPKLPDFESLTAHLQSLRTNRQ